MWVCVCAGKSESKNNSELINIEALSQQELFLMQCDKDKDRKRNQARKGIWTKESNKISCPRALYAVQYFNIITKKPVHVYFKNQHLDGCKSHSSMLKTNPQIIQWVSFSYLLKWDIVLKKL